MTHPGHADHAAGHHPPHKAPKKKSPAKDALRVVLVVAIFVAVAYFLRHPWVQEHLFDIAKLREDIDSLGPWGTVAFALGTALATGLGFPRLWAAGVAGTLFGALEGTAVALAGSILGALITFFLGRSILRGPIKRRMPSRLRPWYDRFSQNGFRWVLYIRLFPLSNATVVNLVCGASKVKAGEFLAATAIGYLPFTLAFALFGSSAAKQSPDQLALGALMFGLVLGSRWIYKAVRRRRDARDADPAEE
ncbi:MAG: VTT domain-containing protein [Candidatus Sumerlaeia bacterium]|nr:VTT domain-containing protein [Candidatus Sumerlaeia bacterium]